MLARYLTNLLQTTLSEHYGEVISTISAPLVFGESTKEGFGDYQTNAAMILAKPLGQNPRALGEELAHVLGSTTTDVTFSIAGPGFINATITNQYLWQVCNEIQSSPTLGAQASTDNETIVVDYSHPNLAKEMHVGHLRSTIIGDSVVKVLEYLGYHVIRQNHMGDWGTQFGMLIAYLETIKAKDDDSQLKDLEEFYRSAKAEFDASAEFADLAREYTVKLQSGDERCLGLWQEFIAISIAHCTNVYTTLGVSLTEADVYPESKFNDDLPILVEELDEKGLLTESDGAQCVFLEAFRTNEDHISPIIVQKQDGGYLYATTDLAAIRYRANVLGAARILYVVDARQSLHLEQVFTLARTAEFLSEHTTLEHLSFGTMMDTDGKPFKTRAGTSVKLMELLGESQLRAREIIAEKSPHIKGDERDELARILGIGSVKYADLSKNRTGDYIFDLDAMLSFEGNTAPYLLYAHTRISSIFTKAGVTISELIPVAGYALSEHEERRLAMQLVRFGEVVSQVAQSGMPNVLCTYLYNLAKKFMSFYEACPVLTEDEKVRNARLHLCSACATTLHTGLGLLGIELPKRM